MLMSLYVLVPVVLECQIHVYMLKNVGDSTPPYGTPFLNWRCVDVLFLNMMYALRPLM